MKKANLLCRLGIHRPLKLGKLADFAKVPGKEVRYATCACGKEWLTTSVFGWFGFATEMPKRHHIWCSYFMRPVEGCKSCERLNREYPQGDLTPEQLKDKYFSGLDVVKQKDLRLEIIRMALVENIGWFMVEWHDRRFGADCSDLIRELAKAIDSKLGGVE